MTVPVTLLGRALPATVDRTVHVLDQGQTISCRGDRWRNALAVVEHGAIEIQTAYGGRRLPTPSNTSTPTNDVVTALPPPPEESPWT